MTTDVFDLAVIGGGNMGAALVEGLLRAGIAAPERLIIVEVSAERRSVLTTMFPGCAVRDDLAPCRAAVVAVKPPDAPAAAAHAARAGARRILSIAAGVTIETLERAIGTSDASGDSSGRDSSGPDSSGPDAAPGHPVAVIRSMPKTPALVGQGASAIAGGAAVTAADRQWAQDVLGAVGLVVEVPEEQLDAITGVTGSGPAYLFLVAESLIDAAVDVGLDREQAAALVRQLFVGSAALLDEGDEPRVLRERVTSPQGTTAAGIAVLQERGLPEALRDAVRAATARSRELGRSR